METNTTPTTTALALVAPYDDDAKLQAMLKDIRAIKHEVIERINANAVAITAANYKCEKLNAFDGEDKALKAAVDRLADEIALKTHVKELFVELAATRNEIKAAVIARQDIIRKIKAENEPAAPKHTYCFQFECDDDGLKKIVATIVKHCGSAFRYAIPQSDKAVKMIEKWFAENF